jgi:mRNA-degrading endonuclease YafQ of YafQ-DinJ toxin-antitoxin module
MAMQFLLADSFQNPGLQCHRLDNIKDKNFWSAHASRDIRLIFHRV